MDPQFKLARHTKLWESGTKSTQRAAVGGLIFAAVVLVNVLQPYAEAADVRSSLAELDREQSDNEETRDNLASHLQRLAEVRATIEAATWMEHKDALIERFASGLVSNPRTEANQTLQDIADEVTRDVVEPLRTIIEQDTLSDRIANLPAAMQRRVDGWLNTYRDEPWYITVASKGATVDELDLGLEGMQDDAIRAVTDLRAAIDDRNRELEQRSAVLAGDLEAQTAEMQQKLDGAIPVWAKGLVSVDLMVQTYTLVLLVLAVYVLGNGLAVARHYHGMADAQGWSAEERSDPVLSSLWTLTWRGPVGTAVTVACYVAVLAALWLCLVLGLRAIGDDGILTKTPWLAHTVMLLTIAAAVIAPMRALRAAGNPAAQAAARPNQRGR